MANESSTGATEADVDQAGIPGHLLPDVGHRRAAGPREAVGSAGPSKAVEASRNSGRYISFFAGEWVTDGMAPEGGSYWRKRRPRGRDW